MTDLVPLLLALAAAAFGAWVALAVRRALARRRWRRVRSRAARGERDAERVLERAGFEIVETQPEVEWPLEIDGEDEAVRVRADYLVARGRMRWVAEVKTGRRAPDPTTTATRRQLLEYRLAYDVDGVLLVDMEAGEISEVVFPLVEDEVGDGRGAVGWLVVGAVIGAAVGALM